MIKTVNEIIKDKLKKIYKYNIVQFDNNVIEDLLHKILYLHEYELAEKDKEINSFKQQIDMAHNFNQNLGSEIEELKQQQLFKEDFENKFIEYSHFDNFVKEKYVLKDNLKYDKLPSKDVK